MRIKKHITKWIEEVGLTTQEQDRDKILKKNKLKEEKVERT